MPYPNIVKITKAFELIGTGPVGAGTVQVYLRGTTTPAVLYTDATGATTTANPTAIVNGAVAAYVLEGSYDLVPTIAGTTYSVTPLEAVSGADVTTVIAALAAETTRAEAAETGPVTSGRLPTTAVQASRYLAPSGGDDASSLAAALTSASAPQVVLSPGTFVLGTPDVTIGSHTTLQGAGMDRTFLSLGDVANANGGMHIMGSESTGGLLVADLLEWQNTFTVSPTDAAHFVPGNLVRFFDPVFATFWVTTVSAVDTGTGIVTLQEESPTICLVANAAYVTIITPVTDVIVKDLTIMLTPGSTPALRILFNVVDFRGVTFERVRFKLLGSNPMPLNAYVIQAAYGRSLKLIDCEMVDIRGDPWTNPLHGFDCTGVTSVEARGCIESNSQAGIALIGCPRSIVIGNRLHGRKDGGGRAIKILNGTNYTTVSGNVTGGYDSIPPATTSHSVTAIHVLDSGHVAVTSNAVLTTGDVGIACTGATVVGAHNLTHHNVIANNVITNTGTSGYPSTGPNPPTRAAIVLGFNGTGVGDPGYHLVAGNEIHGCGGIHVWQSHNKISNNILHGNPYTGNPDIWIRGVTSANVISHNKIASSASAPVVIDTSAGTGGNTVLDNDIEGGQINAALSDTVRAQPAQVVLTDAATVVLDASTGTVFYLAAAGSRTIATPAHGAGMMEIIINIHNATGGAITTTWSTGAGGFRLAGAWVDPAAGKNRILRAFFDPSAGQWIELTRSAADL